MCNLCYRLNEQYKGVKIKPAGGEIPPSIFALCSLQATWPWRWDSCCRWRFPLLTSSPRSRSQFVAASSWDFRTCSLSDAGSSLGWILNSNLFWLWLQEPTKAMFCNHDKQMEQAYEDLLNSSKQTLASMMELQEVQLAAYIIFFLSILWYLLNMIKGFLMVFNTWNYL